MIELNSLPSVKRKRKKRIGRGGSHGTTAGRGTKGTKARSKVPSHIEGGGVPLYRRIPKLSKMKFHKKIKYRSINLDILDEKIKNLPDDKKVNLVVDYDLCVKFGLLSPGEKVKLLGRGDLSHSFSINLDKISANAKEKLKQANCRLITSNDKN